MKTFSPIILFLLLTCLVLGSCRAKRQVTQTNSTTENSKVKVTRYKDTILYTQKTSTGLSLPASVFSKCRETEFKNDLNAFEAKNNKPQVWTQKNGNAKVKIEYIHDTIKVTAECDSIALSAKIREEFQSELNSKISNSSTEKTTGYGIWDLVKAFLVGIVAGIVVSFLLKLFKK